jgi:hypothetical protein
MGTWGIPRWGIPSQPHKHVGSAPWRRHHTARHRAQARVIHHRQLWRHWRHSRRLNVKCPILASAPELLRYDCLSSKLFQIGGNIFDKCLSAHKVHYRFRLTVHSLSAIFLALFYSNFRSSVELGLIFAQITFRFEAGRVWQLEQSLSYPTDLFWRLWDIF